MVSITMKHAPPGGSVGELSRKLLLTLGREFESRRSHTNWDFRSHHAQQVVND